MNLFKERFSFFFRWHSKPCAPAGSASAGRRPRCARCVANTVRVISHIIHPVQIDLCTITHHRWNNLFFAALVFLYFSPTVMSSLGYDVSSVCLSFVCNAGIVVKTYVVGDRRRYYEKAMTSSYRLSIVTMHLQGFGSNFVRKVSACSHNQRALN